MEMTIAQGRIRFVSDTRRYVPFFGVLGEGIKRKKKRVGDARPSSTQIIPLFILENVLFFMSILSF